MIVNGLDRLEARVEVLTLGFELFDFDFDIPRIFPYELTLFLILPSVFILRTISRCSQCQCPLGPDLQMIRYHDSTENGYSLFSPLLLVALFLLPLSFGHCMNRAGRDSRCASTGL